MIAGVSSSDSLAEDHLRHRDRVLRVRPGGDRAHERLVGEREQRVHHVEVARVERLVVRLADRAAGRVELRERLRQPHEVLEVRVGRLAPLEPLADERAAVDGAERHVVAADVDRVARVARLQVELARRLRDLLEDPVGVELDELPVDLLARRLEQAIVGSCGSEVPKSMPSSLTMRRQPRSSSCMDDLVEDLVARHLVDQHGTPGVYTSE